MRVSLIFSLLPLICAEKLVIPQLEQLITSQLELFANYTDYDGPTGTASIALAKSTAHAVITASPRTTSAPSLPTASATVAVRDAGPQKHEIKKRQAAAYWYESIAHQGRAAFNSDSTYKVYRNVKDYGAKGYVIFACLLVPP